MRVIIDTREQLPWELAAEGLETIPGTLQSGDYSIDGYQSLFAIERKSLADFYGSITSGRERFEREISRLSSYHRKAVIIEDSYQSALEPGEHGRNIYPAAITGTIAAWYIRYGVPFIFISSRKKATEFAAALFRQFEKEYILPKNPPKKRKSTTDDAIPF